MLERLASYCAEQGLTTLRMDGETPVNDRIMFMRLFKTDASIRVFLLSTRTTGVDITLTATGTVIFYKR